VALEHLTARTEVLALQSGEIGPIAQAIAGIDLALWDLTARRNGQALWRLLGGVNDRVAVYASGINPDDAVDVVNIQRGLGHTAFKLKIGFGVTPDVDNLKGLRDLLGSEPALMADANQAWNLETAQDMARRIAPFGLTWLEEPLRADRPAPDWAALQAECAVPLAAGENLVGQAAFEAMIDSAAVRVVQPDIAKWGGISGCLPVIARIRKAGLRYCPHYLGGGIGLLHSAHLLAAVGGDGLLEVDVNPNPLRTLLWGAIEGIDQGQVKLGDAPGIGVEPDLEALRQASHGTANKL
jgi:L-alanine-DL-glutamate epimerase-like enolase superfamily enzyme